MGDGGVCETMVILATGNPEGIAIDSHSVYWANYSNGKVPQFTGSVMSVPLNGGTAIQLASSQNEPVAIAVNATNAFWTVGSMGGTATGFVMTVGIDGGSPVTLASPPNVLGPYGIAVDATSVYWPNLGGFVNNHPRGSIMKLALDGGPAQQLASGQTTPTGLAVDATNVYWINSGGFNSDAVMTTSLDGKGTPLQLAPASDPQGIVLDSKNVYWTNGAGGSIMSVPLDGGVISTIATAQRTPWGIVVDGDNLYWVNEGVNDGTANGTIAKLSLDGGTFIQLASGQASPRYIAVDATSVYWSNTGSGINSGTIVKLTPK